MAAVPIELLVGSSNWCSPFHCHVVSSNHTGAPPQKENLTCVDLVGLTTIPSVEGIMYFDELLKSKVHKQEDPFSREHNSEFGSPHVIPSRLCALLQSTNTSKLLGKEMDDEGEDANKSRSARNKQKRMQKQKTQSSASNTPDDSAERRFLETLTKGGDNPNALVPELLNHVPSMPPLVPHQDLLFLEADNWTVNSTFARTVATNYFTICSFGSESHESRAIEELQEQLAAKNICVKSLICGFPSAVNTAQSMTDLSSLLINISEIQKYITDCFVGAYRQQKGQNAIVLVVRNCLSAFTHPCAESVPDEMNFSLLLLALTSILHHAEANRKWHHSSGIGLDSQPFAIRCIFMTNRSSLLYSLGPNLLLAGEQKFKVSIGIVLPDMKSHTTDGNYFGLQHLPGPERKFYEFESTFRRHLNIEPLVGVDSAEKTHVRSICEVLADKIVELHVEAEETFETNIPYLVIIPSDLTFVNTFVQCVKDKFVSDPIQLVFASSTSQAVFGKNANIDLPSRRPLFLLVTEAQIRHESSARVLRGLRVQSGSATSYVSTYNSLVLHCGIKTTDSASDQCVAESWRSIYFTVSRMIDLELFDESKRQITVALPDIPLRSYETKKGIDDRHRRQLTLGEALFSTQFFCGLLSMFRLTSASSVVRSLSVSLNLSLLSLAPFLSLLWKNFLSFSAAVGAISIEGYDASRDTMRIQLSPVGRSYALRFVVESTVSSEITFLVHKYLLWCSALAVVKESALPKAANLVVLHKEYVGNPFCLGCYTKRCLFKDEEAEESVNVSAGGLAPFPSFLIDKLSLFESTSNEAHSLDVNCNVLLQYTTTLRLFGRAEVHSESQRSQSVDVSLLRLIALACCYPVLEQPTKRGYSSLSPLVQVLVSPQALLPVSTREWLYCCSLVRRSLLDEQTTKDFVLSQHAPCRNALLKDTGHINTESYHYGFTLSQTPSLRPSFLHQLNSQNVPNKNWIFDRPFVQLPQDDGGPEQNLSDASAEQPSTESENAQKIIESLKKKVSEHATIVRGTKRFRKVAQDKTKTVVNFSQSATETFNFPPCGEFCELLLCDVFQITEPTGSLQSFVKPLFTTIERSDFLLATRLIVRSMFDNAAISLCRLLIRSEEASAAAPQLPECIRSNPTFRLLTNRMCERNLDTPGVTPVGCWLDSLLPALDSSVPTTHPESTRPRGLTPSRCTVSAFRRTLASPNIQKSAPVVPAEVSSTSSLSVESILSSVSERDRLMIEETVAALVVFGRAAGERKLIGKKQFAFIERQHPLYAAYEALLKKHMVGP